MARETGEEHTHGVPCLWGQLPPLHPAKFSFTPLSFPKLGGQSAPHTPLPLLQL